MRYTNEEVDATSTTHAESARVESRYESLNSNATKTAFDELDRVLDGLSEQVIHTIHEQPMLPAAGSADSLAELGLAETTGEEGEIISSKTPETESQTTTVVSAEEGELREPCNEADKKAKELLGPYHALQVRISGELFPILHRIKTLLPYGEWTPWYDNFCKRHHITTSIRTIQRGFAELTGDRLLTDGKPGAKSTQNRVAPSEPEAVTIARRELAQLEEQIGTSPTGNDAKRLHAEYKDKLTAAISQAQIESTVPLPIIDGTTAPGSAGSPGPEPREVYESPKKLLTKWMERQRKALSGREGPVDADPIREGGRRIDTAVLMLDELKLALDEGLLDPVPQVASLRHEINQHDHSGLTKVPLHLREANAFVSKVHRHHSPIRVAKFSIGAFKDGKLVGVAICMRPACRSLDDGRTIEVCRVAAIPFEDDDDARNACSFLYGACARIAREMGFDKIMTYLLDTEPGMSVRGAGWTLEKRGCGGTPQGKRTNRPNGHEITPVTFMKKQRWGKLLQPQPQAKNAKAISSVPVEAAHDEADVA